MSFSRLLLSSIVFIALGCGSEGDSLPPSKFSRGDTVIIKVNNKKGVVGNIHHYADEYEYTVQYADNLGVVHEDTFTESALQKEKQ